MIGTTYPVIVHIEEVLDGGSLLTDHLSLSFVDDNWDTTRMHRFPVWLGWIDSTGLGGKTESSGQEYDDLGMVELDGGLEDDTTI